MSEIVIKDALAAILSKTKSLPDVITAGAHVLETDDFLQEIRKNKPSFPGYPVISAAWAGMNNIRRVRGSGDTAGIKRPSLFEIIVLCKSNSGRSDAVDDLYGLMDVLFFGLCYQDFGLGADVDLSMITAMNPFRVLWDKSVAGGYLEIDLAWENQVTNA